LETAPEIKTLKRFSAIDGCLKVLLAGHQKTLEWRGFLGKGVKRLQESRGATKTEWTHWYHSANREN